MINITLEKKELPINLIGSLKGDIGISAYQFAVDGGYKGTEEEFAKEMANAANKVDKEDGLALTNVKIKFK